MTQHIALFSGLREVFPLQDAGEEPHGGAHGRAQLPVRALRQEVSKETGAAQTRPGQLP